MTAFADYTLHINVVTYFAQSFKKSNGKYCSEASESRADGSQERQERCPKHAEQHEQFAANFLRQHSTDDVRRRVAVKERSKNEALSLCIPVEDHTVLKQAQTLTLGLALVLVLMPKHLVYFWLRMKSRLRRQQTTMRFCKFLEKINKHTNLCDSVLYTQQ